MKPILFVIMLLISFAQLQGQGNIGINTESPENSALLHLESNDKGLLIPRLLSTEKESIQDPAQGLLVYQTDGEKGFYVFEDGKWDAIKSENSLEQIINVDEDGNLVIQDRSLIIKNTMPVDNEGTPPTTNRIVLESWEKSNNLNDHAGDLIQLMWRDSQAKPFIGWWDYTGEEPILKAWIGAHQVANDGASFHKHLSIETADLSGQMQTRMDFDFDKDTTEIKTSSANFTVGGQHKFRASGQTTLQGETLILGELYVKNQMITRDISLEGKDGKQRLLAVKSTSTGDYASTIRFTGESTGIDHFRGGYLQYDASGNQIIIGAHNDANMDLSSDIEVIRIPRNGGSVEIVPNLELGVGSRIKSVEHDNGIGINNTGSFFYNNADNSRSLAFKYGVDSDIQLITNQERFTIDSDGSSNNFTLDFETGDFTVGLNSTFLGDVDFKGSMLDMNDQAGVAGQILKRKGDQMVYGIASSVGNVEVNGSSWTENAQCLVVTGTVANTYALPLSWLGEDGDVLTFLNKSTTTQTIQGNIDNIASTSVTSTVQESMEFIWDADNATWWHK